MADAKAKGTISEEAIEKKMMSFNNSQDSVQAMSLWIMHNKAHHQKIVNTWLNVLKKCEVKHKLTLFYLCNDVVQHAKKKKALYYLENFKNNLREAVGVIKEYDSIKPNIGRVFKIWEDRKTYDPKFVAELRTILDGGSTSKNSSASGTPATASPAYLPSSKSRHKSKRSEKSAQDAEIPPESPEESVQEEVPTEEVKVSLSDFKPPVFLEQMSSLRKMEGDVTSKAKQLASLRIDATNIEAIKQLKDRSHGNEFCRQFEESCIKIEDYVSLLEREITQRHKVLSFCDAAEEFYSEQYREANIVCNAYKNFGQRVTNMKKRVDDMKKIIPSTPSPVPSPTADAPSPGNTPPLLNMDDNETVDMDLDNEDPAADVKKGSESTGSGRAYTSMVKSISQPIASVTDIVMGHKEDEDMSSAPMIQGVPPPSKIYQGSNILESRIAHMLPSLVRGVGGSTSQPAFTNPSAPAMASEDFPLAVTPYPEPSAVPAVYTPSRQEIYGEAKKVDAPAPLNDDTGSATPVMDEPEDKSPPHVVEAKSKESSAVKTKPNPIDFLSQLLTKTTSASSSSSSNFLQTLSLLTNTVKTQYQSKKEANKDMRFEEERHPRPPSPPPPVEHQSALPMDPSRTWSAWNPAPNSQPPMPLQDPSSPPVIGQAKRNEPSLPPLPSGPPNLPPEPRAPPQPYNPIHQDFSLPPPSMQPPGSQVFVSPPPLPPSSNPFSSMQSSDQFSSSSISSVPSFNLESVTSSIAAPTTLVSTGPNKGFNPHSHYPFGNVPPNHPPPSPAQQSSPRFMPPGGNPWEQPKPMIPTPPPGMPPNLPPPLQSTPQFPPYGPPPPPPASNAAMIPSWQQDQAGGEQFNQNSTGPVQSSDWNTSGQGYQQQGSWESNEEKSGPGYQHPWDQPQEYEDEEEENDYNEPVVNSLPPPPKKSILRNSRTSSLREVILVDESNSQREKSSGGFRKPPTGINYNVNDTQSEFINILKQKSGAADNLPPPPSSRTLTNITVHSNEQSGQAISTIGVIGSGGGRPASVHSDDMEIENDNEHEYIEAADDNDAWNRNDRDNGHHFNKEQEWAEENNRPGVDNSWHQEALGHGDPEEDSYTRGQRWPEQQRPWQPQPRFEQEPFRPRGFNPRPRFQENFTGPRDNFRAGAAPHDHFMGPSPGKRPFFSPRNRMPYNRY